MAPRSRVRVAIGRWGKTLAQSAAIVFLFLVPLIVAFGQQYGRPIRFYVTALVNLCALLTIPVSMAAIVILLLVRWFPVGRVHQIVASVAVLVLSAAVVAFRMSRPERFFAEISTDDVARVLRSIELPSMSIYPSTSLAEMMTAESPPLLSLRIVVFAAVLFGTFVIAARSWYFKAFVRARESMAPVAVGSASANRLFDRLLTGADPPFRALLSKEIRTIGRDVAQWSQLVLTAALLFIYLYNIRMLPLGGDSRATLVSYANLGMAGFVIAGIALRFAYPSVSTEGKAFWILQSAPVSYRQFMIVKVVVYAAPLTVLSLLLTVFANLLLNANNVVWTFTMIGASLLAITLVSLGVGLGGLMPNFNAENPLQVGLSLGGFAYMAISMGYVGLIMVLMARPVVQYLLANVLRVTERSSWVTSALPIAIAVSVSVLLAVVPLVAAERRLTHITEND